MQILIILAMTAVAVFQTSRLTPSPTRSPMLLVRSVASGDSIEVMTVGRVRLVGIAVENPGASLDATGSVGREARDRLAQLATHGGSEIDLSPFALTAR